VPLSVDSSGDEFVLLSKLHSLGVVDNGADPENSVFCGMCLNFMSDVIEELYNAAWSGGLFFTCKELCGCVKCFVFFFAFGNWPACCAVHDILSATALCSRDLHCAVRC
jgi:hypothetical protein